MSDRAVIYMYYPGFIAPTSWPPYYKHQQLEFAHRQGHKMSMKRRCWHFQEALLALAGSDRKLLLTKILAKAKHALTGLALSFYVRVHAWVISETQDQEDDLQEKRRGGQRRRKTGDTLKPTD